MIQFYDKTPFPSKNSNPINSFFVHKKLLSGFFIDCDWDSFLLVKSIFSTFSSPYDCVLPYFSAQRRSISYFLHISSLSYLYEELLHKLSKILTVVSYFFTAILKSLCATALKNLALHDYQISSFTHLFFYIVSWMSVRLLVHQKLLKTYSWFILSNLSEFFLSFWVLLLRLLLMFIILLLNFKPFWFQICNTPYFTKLFSTFICSADSLQLSYDLLCKYFSFGWLLWSFCLYLLYYFSFLSPQWSTLLTTLSKISILFPFSPSVLKSLWDMSTNSWLLTIL